jgi:hypothetical protein
VSNVDITCPSRLAFTARPIGGKEMRGLGSTLETALIGLANGCHVNTTAAGCYSWVHEGDGRPAWTNIFWADLLYANIAIRRASFPMTRDELGFVNKMDEADKRPIGDVLDFDFNCNQCRKLVDYSIDLADYVRDYTRVITDDAHDRLLNKEPLELFTLGEHARLLWRPGTPAMDTAMKAQMKAAMQRRETAVEFVAKHVVRVVPKGKDVKDLTDLRSIYRWVADQSAEQIDHLFFHIREEQPSFENELRVVCTHNDCGAEQLLLLPFGHPSFTYPRSAPQAKRAMRAMEEARVEKRRRTDEEREANPINVPPSSTSSTQG